MTSTSYQNGYTIGKNWTENFRPGGPLKLDKPSNSSVRKAEIYAANKVEIEDFFLGFDEGIKKMEICGVNYPTI